MNQAGRVSFGRTVSGFVPVVGEQHTLGFALTEGFLMILGKPSVPQMQATLRSPAHQKVKVDD
ncbi:MAG: hypothetical protein R3F07_11455 [Opitutaceae bacterium]